MARDPRVDAFIAGAQPFARPILTHVREIIHQTCPDVVETIKWSRPFFEYKGRMFAALGAFKAHASLVLWRMGEMGDATSREREGMGQFGRLTSLADLPDDGQLTAIVRTAMEAIETGKPARPKKPPRAALPVLPGGGSAKAPRLNQLVRVRSPSTGPITSGRQDSPKNGTVSRPRPVFAG